MRVSVYGATGMVGSRVAAEAVSRGHEVTGVSRRGGGVPEGVSAEQGDAADPAFAADLAGRHDVVVSALGPSRTSPDDGTFLRTVQTLVANLGDARLLVVGGAGSLEVDGVRLVDSPGFPDAYKPEALLAAETLAYLRDLGTGPRWTYLSPAPEIAPGERTGNYQVALDSPAGARVSAEDYAVALVDEIEDPQHEQVRFTVAG